MATAEELGEMFRNVMSTNFGLPAEWFQFPLIIFNFIIPLIGLSFLWYTVLDKKLRIFRNSFANFAIAILISLISSPLIVAFSPVIILAIALGGTIFFWGNFSFVRIIIALLIAGVILFFYPSLLSLVQNAVQP